MSSWTGQVTVTGPDCSATGVGEVVTATHHGRADWRATIGLHELQPKLASAKEVAIQLGDSGKVISGLVMNAPVRMSSTGVLMTLFVACSNGEPIELP